jgi:pantothenate kinase
MELEELKNRLKKYKRSDIIITEHADLQAFSRRINLEEVKDNILNPTRLVHFNKEKTENQNEERYECFFEYSANFYHKYAIILNRKIIIVTVIVINRRWQEEVR